MTCISGRVLTAPFPNNVGLAGCCEFQRNEERLRGKLEETGATYACAGSDFRTEKTGRKFSQIDRYIWSPPVLALLSGMPFLTFRSPCNIYIYLLTAAQFPAFCVFPPLILFSFKFNFAMSYNRCEHCRWQWAIMVHHRINKSSTVFTVKVMVLPTLSLALRVLNRLLFVHFFMLSSHMRGCRPLFRPPPISPLHF